MALIANINGKPVFSDKKTRAIVGSKVVFTDGSWCDVDTGQIHNTGEGYIKIDGTDSESNSKRTTKADEVAASVLEISDIVANVTIEVHTGNDIQYEMTGNAEYLATVKVNVEDDTLIIEGGDSDASNWSGNNIIIGSSGGVIFGDNSSMVTIGKERTTVVTNSNKGSSSLTVKVPSGTPITVSNVRGDVVIGDTNGPLMANVQGSNDIHAGCVTTAQLSVEGTGDILIDKANGPVMANIEGSGSIKVADGTMPSLTATVLGSGNIEVGGTATKASLRSTGSGDIHVAHVEQRPRKSSMGSGSIRVGRIG